jgi:acyl carrier protein
MSPFSTNLNAELVLYLQARVQGPGGARAERGYTPATLPRVSEATISGELTAMVTELAGISVSASQPLMEAGLDSLAAVELRNAIGAKFGMDLPATAMFDYPTLDALSRFVAQRALPAQPAGAALPAAAVDASVVESEIREMVTGACLLLVTTVVRLPPPPPLMCPTGWSRRAFLNMPCS